MTPPESKTSSYALVIGNSEYATLSKLENAEKDALDVYENLVNSDFSIFSQENSECETNIQSCSEFHNVLKKFFNYVEGFDLILVYFAGHGILNKETKKLYLGMANTDENDLPGTAFSVDSIFDFFKRSDKHRYIVALDCCRAAAAFSAREIICGRGKVIIASSLRNQTADDGIKSSDNGLFSRYFIKGIQGDAAEKSKPYISIVDLYDYIEEMMLRDPENHLEQEPTIKIGEGTGKLPVAKNPNYAQKKKPFHSDLFKDTEMQSFFGRTEDIGKLKKTLIDSEQGTSRVAALVGQVGVGKSALAWKFACEYQSEFQDGIVMRSISTEKGKSALDIAQDFASFWDTDNPLEETEEIKGNSASKTMQRVFSNLQVLLILDSADDLNVVDALLPTGNQKYSVIITTHSNEYIPYYIRNSEDEKCFPLNCPDPSDAKEILKAFSNRQWQKIFNSHSSSSDVERIFKMTGRLPLALKMVGIALSYEDDANASDLAKIADKMEQPPRLKSLENEAGGISNETRLRKSIEINYKQLEKQLEEKSLFFFRLSVFTEQGFSENAANAVGGNTSIESSTLLKRLSRRYLLEKVKPYESEIRYRFQPMTYSYAYLQLERKGNEKAKQEAKKAHALFFLKKLKSLDIEDSSTHQSIKLDLLEISRAVEWVRHQSNSESSSVIVQESLWQSGHTLNDFLDEHGYGNWFKASAIMDSFYLLAENSHEWLIAFIFKLRRAKYLSFQGKLAEAEKSIDPIDVAQDIGKIEDSSLRSKAEIQYLIRYGRIISQRNSTEAEKKLRTAVEKATKQLKSSERDDSEGSGYKLLRNALDSLGAILLQKKEFRKALEVYVQVSEENNRLEDQRSQVKTLLHQAVCYWIISNNQKALELIKESDKLNERVQDRSAKSLSLKIKTFLNIEYDEEEKTLGAFKDEISRLGSQNSETNALKPWIRLVLALYGKEASEIFNQYKEDIYTSKELSSPSILAKTLMTQGGLVHQYNKPSVAQLFFVKASQYYEYLEDLEPLFKAMGNVDDRLKKKIHDLSKKIKKEGHRTRNRENLVKKREDLTQKRKELIEAIIRLCSKTNDLHMLDLAKALNRRGILHKSIGRHAEALDDFKKQITVGAQIRSSESESYEQFRRGTLGIYSLRKHLSEEKSSWAECILKELREKVEAAQRSIYDIALLNSKIDFTLSEGQLKNIENELNNKLSSTPQDSKKITTYKIHDALSNLYRRKAKLLRDSETPKEKISKYEDLSQIHFGKAKNFSS